MAYTQKTWKTGEAITAAALNNLESGAAQNASDIQSIQGALPTYVGDSVTKKAAATYTPGTTNQTIASGQYLTGAQTIKGDPNLKAANIKSGTSIFGVTGTYTGAGSGVASPTLQAKSVTPSGAAQTVTPDSGYDGLSQVTVDAIPSTYVQPSGTKTITANGTYSISSYETVTVSVPTSGSGLDTSDATATASDIAEGKTAYVNGELVEGTLSEGEPSSTSANTTVVHVNNTVAGITLNLIRMVGVASSDVLCRKEQSYALYKNATEFGDATAADVAAGKTFTSASGLKVTGTGSISGPAQAQQYEGTFTTDASGNATVNCGFKPDAVLIKVSHDDTYECNLNCIFAGAESPGLTQCAITWNSDYTSIYEADFSQLSNGFYVEIYGYSANWQSFEIPNATYSFVAVKYT